MPSSTFPTTLADLRFNDSSFPSSSSSLYRAIRDLRKSTLSLSNRLQSIHHDSEFVQAVATQHSSLPLVANERCGSWYIPPSSKVGSAYFKSTDGHHGQWDFSLRRLNLQLLSLLGTHGGVVLVDSTRRGKSLPDALAKTVPIWAAVMNRALFPESGEGHALQVWRRGKEGLGLSEVKQIEERLDGFVESLKDLKVDLEALRKAVREPIRIKWVVNGLEDAGLGGNGDWDMLEDVGMGGRGFCLLVLCSASRRVRGAEISEGGYIQGAGDDSEAWAHGLTPTLFWEHQDLLLAQTSQEDLEEIVQGLVSGNDGQVGQADPPVLVTPTTNIYIGSTATGYVGAGNVDINFDLIVNCNVKPSSMNPRVLDLDCRTGKLGSRDLREKLPSVKSFITTTIERKPDCKILITCGTGKDLSVGVAVMFLCLFFDDKGSLNKSLKSHQPDKTLVKQRLVWISSVKPDVNPSRSTLQSINAFLMERR